LILQQPFLAGEIRERQSDVALALIGGIVHGDHQSFPLGASPGENQEALGLHLNEQVLQRNQRKWWDLADSLFQRNGPKVSSDVASLARSATGVT